VLYQLTTSSVNGSPARTAPRGLSICHQVSQLRQGVRDSLGDGPDSTVGLKTVARITCPLCGTRFHQDAKGLLPIESPIQVFS
jgi:hypothetical protein